MERTGKWSSVAGVLLDMERTLSDVRLVLEKISKEEPAWDPGIPGSWPPFVKQRHFAKTMLASAVVRAERALDQLNVEGWSDDPVSQIDIVKEIRVRRRLGPRGPIVLENLPLQLGTPVSAGKFWGPSDITKLQFKRLTASFRPTPERFEREWAEIVEWRKAHPNAQRELVDLVRKNRFEDRIAKRVAQHWKWKTDSNFRVKEEDMEAYKGAVKAAIERANRHRRPSETVAPPGTRSTARRTPSLPQASLYVVNGERLLRTLERRRRRPELLEQRLQLRVRHSRDVELLGIPLWLAPSYEEGPQHPGCPVVRIGDGNCREVRLAPLVCGAGLFHEVLSPTLTYIVSRRHTSVVSE